LWRAGTLTQRCGADNRRMSNRPCLQDFIDDELLRAPMTFDAVVDAVHACWQMRLPVHDRLDGNPVRALHLHRDELVAEALHALTQAAQSDLKQGRTAENAPPAPPARALPLALIGEEDVVVDIEIARCVRTIAQMAEIELRELHTFTSALVLDINVARDTNPFRPERFVRALWSGVQRVPLSRPVLTGFMHEAALPLAQALRRGYASASRRLEDQGVTPAAHRTIVQGSTTTWGAEASRYRPPPDLQTLHNSLPAALQTPLAATRSMPRQGVATQSDAQQVELLSTLFSTILNDRALAPQTVAVIQRLQPTVQRLALHDASMLEAYDHPAWRFMDQLVHDLECSAPARLARLQGLCRNLVDHLAAADTPESSQFSWAIVRLAAARRHTLAQDISAAKPQIDKLQRMIQPEAMPSTATMPLDIGTLDTVPAELMPEPRGDTPLAGATTLVQASVPGTVLRVYLQGEWRLLVTLWQDEEQELLLLAEPATDRLWALRQPALVRLLAQRLARRLRVRSLVKRAAGKLLPIA
jgi:hypothetical protein